MAEQEEDFSSLPLQDRFVHKNWKVRKEAYEAAAKEFDNAQTESDPVVRQFVQDTSLWKAAVTDSNAAAHQEALNTLCSFLQIAGSQGSIRTRNTVVGPLVEKGLISAKPAAKQKATEAILLLIEMDKPDPVIEEMLPFLSHKLPKIVAATLAAFTSIYHAYGCKTVEPKQVLKILPKAYGHADKNVRAEAQNLTVELYRWLKDGMKPLFWNDLKPVQQQDLEKLFEPVKSEPPPKPERLLKSQQAAIAAAPPAAENGENGAPEDEADEEIDLEPEVMAVDVFQKIPKDFSERLGSSKWKDRKEVLEELHTAVNVPAIEDGQFNEIVQGLAKSMKDANIAVVTEAAICIELLAKGLRKSFAKYRSTIMGPIIERLKERKQSVTDALGAALDAVFASSNFADCLEEVLGFSQHKNPQVKLETTKFLTRCLKNTREAPTVPETKLIADAATKQLTDSQETQRNAGAEVLGTLWKIMGDRVMNTHLDGLDDIRKAKIKEYYESAEVKAKYKPKAAAPPPAPKAAAAPGKKPPPGAKKAAPVAKKPATPAPAPVEEQAPSKPLQPKPTARPGGLPKPGGLPAPAGRGLRQPTAGLSGTKTPQKVAASPRRAPSPFDDDPAPVSKPLSRGLTGRQLAKPSNTSAAEQPPTPAPQTAALTSVEKFELEELRIEVERLRSSNETIRNENVKLSSQVNELQDQNAQLIEDHTRDVLSIKAKETQLVRARSDAESAEQMSTQLQREVDRLKRELGRIGRASSPRASEYGAVDIFQDASITGSTRSRPGITSPTTGSYRDAPSNSTSRSPSRPNSTLPTSSSAFNRPSSRSAMAGAPPSNGYGNMGPPTSNSKPGTPGVNGNANPLGDVDTRSSGGSTGTTQSRSRGSESENFSGGAAAGSTNGQQPGVESWKRAAEVTQNLKARIELMKAKQMQGQR